MSSFPKQQGAATLIITIISLVIITMIVLFAANYTVMQQKITSNDYRKHQALAAAEAGLDYAIPYLALNQSTILANPVNGFLVNYSDSNTTNVTLGNQSKYSFSYTNPIANRYDLLTITSKGVSDDNSSTKTVQQQVKFGAHLVFPPTNPLISQSNINLTGNTNIINTQSNSTVRAGGGVTLSGSAQTTTSTGKSSTSSTIKSDVQQNDNTLATQSPSDLFKSYFGVDSQVLKNNIDNYYTNSISTNYSTLLNGKQGTSIWIDQSSGDATLSGNVTLGTAEKPVILIVNGNLQLTGTATIYGLVYVMGGSVTKQLGGTLDIYGGLIATGNITINGTAKITFDTNLLTTIHKTLGYYAKVPGSWRDF